MNILMATDEYRPLTGGLEYAIDIITHELRKQGHRVCILAPQFPHAAAEPHIYRLRSLPSPFGRNDRLSLPAPKITLAELLKTQWDVVHIHTPYNIGHISAWLAKKSRAKQIYTCHTILEHFTYAVPIIPQSILKWGARFWISRFCNRSDAVIAPSHDVHDLLLKQGVKKPIHVFKTPIYGDDFDPVNAQSPYEALGFYADEKICLYVGQIAQEKNIKFLLDAFTLIHDADAKTRLVLIGDGPFRKEAQKFIHQRGLEKIIFILGYLPRQELSLWYHYTHVFLFASTIETQGMSVAEALYFGLPPIIVDGTGTREAVQNGINGLITPKKRSLFAKAAIHFLSNPELQKKLIHGSQFIKPDASNAVVNALMDIYQP